MSNLTLESELIELIERRAEGEYWDFKEQWHCRNNDLLHDILCMANSPANRDCYIIIGVKDKTCDIIGIDVEDKNRKNQQNVIDLLHQKPKWAGGYIPEAYVKTVILRDKEIDVIIIKHSDYTPFYLLEDYKGEGQPLFKGAIYTRKADTNTPRTSTADLHDTEILWKRRFGLLYTPSQRAKFYLNDLENWEFVDGEKDKHGLTRFFYYYKLDPDYTLQIKYDSDEEEKETQKMSKDINEDILGDNYYYLFAFCNVRYHYDFDDSENITLYYKDIPICNNSIESVDEGRTKIVPPELIVNPYYIKDSFRYLVFEFVFFNICKNHSNEAREMFLHVIPVYESESEYNTFENYIKARGFSYTRINRS